MTRFVHAVTILPHGNLITLTGTLHSVPWETSQKLKRIWFLMLIQHSVVRGTFENWVVRPIIDRFNWWHRGILWLSTLYLLLHCCFPTGFLLFFQNKQDLTKILAISYSYNIFDVPILSSIDCEKYETSETLVSSLPTSYLPTYLPTKRLSPVVSTICTLALTDTEKFVPRA